MAIRLSLLLPTALSLSIVSLEACSPDSATAGTPDATSDMPSEPGLPLTFVARGNTLPFTPISGSALCSPGGGAQQLVLPAGYVQTVDAIEGPGFLDQSDMNTVNETGPLKGRLFMLSSGAYRLGKAPRDLPDSKAIVIAGDRFLSKDHAVILVEPNEIVLTDPGSTNGCFVNGNKVTHAALENGDEIRLGESLFRFTKLGS